VNRRGVALLLVLWVIGVLGVVGAAIAQRQREGADAAANAVADAVARQAAESGVLAAEAALEAAMRSARDATVRAARLNAADRVIAPVATGALADARWAVVVVDATARLDVNAADAGQLTRLLGYFAPPSRARAIALRIVAAQPLASLDILRDVVPGDDLNVVAAAASYLTVDGDGTINRVTASDTVLAVAGGELRDTPGRLVLVARGWRDGHPLVRELQAVYAVATDDLALVTRRARWR
jgi:hypothetical protein